MHLKTAYELGIQLALEEAGLTKSAIDWRALRGAVTSKASKLTEAIRKRLPARFRQPTPEALTEQLGPGLSKALAEGQYGVQKGVFGKKS